MEVYVYLSDLIFRVLAIVKKYIGSDLRHPFDFVHQSALKRDKDETGVMSYLTVLGLENDMNRSIKRFKHISDRTAKYILLGIAMTGDRLDVRNILEHF